MTPFKVTFQKYLDGYKYFMVNTQTGQQREGWTAGTKKDAHEEADRLIRNWNG